VKVSWDIAAYSYAVGGQDGANRRKEKVLSDSYRPLNAIVSSNTTVVDRSGKILAWLLPELLSAQVRVCPISSVKSNLIPSMP
jgi:hypothetical protein